MLHSPLKTITIVIDILSEVRKLLTGIENDYKKGKILCGNLNARNTGV